MQLTASRVFAEYCRRTPTSEKLAADAAEVFPSGVTHDSRYLRPYPIYVERAEGSRKWDVDGNEYVDYTGGHGALLLGHNHPQITAAVQQQLSRGTHYGSCHELEVHWGQMVQQLIPSAERVRFTSSGTEATLLAFRLARAYTGRSKILRFITNFHGWQDHVAFGVTSHHDGTPTPGVLQELAEGVVLSPPGDIQTVRRILGQRDDVAAVILEPTGASWGQIPVPESFLRELRAVTAETDVLLIFDEVISGFRCSPGGAQAHFNITPELTTLAKIIAGGYPGGAVVGRQDILDLLDHQAAAAQGHEKIHHPGTFNANPVSAAAGTTALQILAETDACQRAIDYAGQLRESLSRVIQDEDVDWCVYGMFSGFHIYTNPDHETVTTATINAGRLDYRKLQAAAASEVAMKLRVSMLAHGVEIFGWPGGPTSAVHNDDDLERTAEALRQTIHILRDEGDL